ncbi:MAG: malectin domain-containing carbohydrate-binding protein [Planctomycetota bacterium]
MLPGVDIQGTTNDELFRTGRTQLARYLVAVPNGRYDVVLHFACLIDGRLWHPTIDVRIEGETIVDGLDARQLGRLSATSHRCESVQVTDGALGIELSQSDVALCGVEIVRQSQ